MDGGRDGDMEGRGTEKWRDGGREKWRDGGRDGEMERRVLLGGPRDVCVGGVDKEGERGGVPMRG